MTKKLKIFLTGSGGFIGKNLKQDFEVSNDVVAPRSFELDLTNENQVCDFLENKTFDVIIHCASIGGARGVEDSQNTVDVNLKMFNNLLKAKSKDTPIITFGSGAMYDRRRNLHKVKESEIGKFCPIELYGLSKMKMAEIVKQRDDVLMLNIFACYGYGEKESRFPSYAIKQVLNKEKIIINQNVIFDYLFVEDMIKIVNYFVEHKSQDKLINITPTKSCSLLEIAQLVGGEQYGIEIKNPEMNNEYTGDNSLLFKNIRNPVFTPLEVGLEKLKNYIQNF